jgi:uncharacterized damage-inducible protein DinB
METLIQQMGYDGWANQQMVRAASALDPQLLRQALPGSFPSVHQTLLHILWAEELWLRRWLLQSFPRALDPGDYPTLESLGRGLESVQARQLQFLKGLDPPDPERKIAYVNFQGVRWEYTLRHMIQHLVLHSAFHRGQLNTMFRSLGTVPSNTDYLNFIDLGLD